MSGRDVDVDALFDRDADTQLLDRRREELGLTRQAAPAVSTPIRFGPESILGDEVPQRPRAAMLRVALDARPERELIPGAVVTVVVSVHDDGDARADDVLLRVSVPHECEPVAGSFVRGDDELDGEALLGEGLRVGTIAAGEAIRVRFAMRVLSGTEPLDVVAHASAPGVSAIAAPALRLERRAGHAAFDAPRPFFELETGELDDAVLAAADAPAIAEPEPPRAVDAVIDEPAVPVVVAPPAVVEPAVVARPYAPAVVIVKRAPPEPVVTEPPVVESVEPEPQPTAPPEPPPAPVPAPRARPEAHPAGPYVLARTLDDEEVSALERVFDGDVPHGLAALALLSSIAAADTPLGEALGIRAFARSVATAVPRALIAARMDRAVPPVVTREALEMIRAFAPAPDDPYPQYFPLLVTRMDERELGALRTVLERDLDDVFLRGLQVLLAVAPRALEGVKSDVTASAVDAMAAYRAAAGAWLMRVTVRRAVDRRYDPLTAADASLHEAGRKLVAALRGSFG
ncbi:MAG TPA: hypothetical protein VE826_03205 [Dongiaceae bacterium]|nr:hypothetical protein [Dongiaceae bacterium]